MKDDLSDPLLPGGEAGFRNALIRAFQARSDCLRTFKPLNASYLWWLAGRGRLEGFWGGGRRITTHESRITIYRVALLAALLALAGCGPQPFVREGNYVTYDHPFTEASAQAVRKNAEGICRERNQAAFESSRACSLTQCTTSYQCMSEEDARRLIGEKRK